jgi:hypothetical protein
MSSLLYYATTNSVKYMGQVKLLGKQSVIGCTCGEAEEGEGCMHAEFWCRNLLKRCHLNDQMEKDIEK